jgi:hypothetical protein
VAGVLGEAADALAGAQPAEQELEQSLLALAVILDDLANVNSGRELLRGETQGDGFGLSFHGANPFITGFGAGQKLPAAHPALPAAREPHDALDCPEMVPEVSLSCGQPTQSLVKHYSLPAGKPRETSETSELRRVRRSRFCASDLMSKKEPLLMKDKTFHFFGIGG